MKHFLVAAVLTVTLLAGCFGGSDEASPEPDQDAGDQPEGESDSPPVSPAPSPTTPPATPTPAGPVSLLQDFSITGCTGLSAPLERPSTELQPLLPEGYVVHEPTPGTGIIAVDAFTCANLTVGSAVLPDAHFGHVYIQVEPRPDLFDINEAGRHEYLLDVMAPQGIMAALWLAAGMPVHVGNATMTAAGAPSPLQQATATFGEYALSAAIATAPDQASLPFTRYYQTEEGNTVLWLGQEDGDSGGSGPSSVATPTESHLATSPPPAGVATYWTARAWSDMQLWNVLPTANDGGEATG